MEKLANTLWKRGESEEGEGWVESVAKRRDKQKKKVEEREEWSSVGRCDGGEGRVEFSREM